MALRVVEWRRGKGHDTIHLRDEGLQRLPNGAIFDKAAAERRILLTFDLDFGRDLEQGAIIVVEETRHRVRHLPLGG